jgi:hypothetical protein
MSFVQRELDRIAEAIRQPQSEEAEIKLHAAQQALAWALEPEGFASPYDAINRLNNNPPTGTPEGSEDCSAPRHQLRS